MTCPDDTPPAGPGGFRTYVRRRGRMTSGQARALEQLTDRYLCPADATVLDVASRFGRQAPLGLEIGFGMGHALIDWAVQRPDWNLLGVEVYQPGIGAAMLGLEREGLTNVRLLEAPAEYVLNTLLGPASLDEVRIFFPDPWPKKRHHKRRLIQPELARLVASRLRPGGLLWVATDWEPYAHWIIDVLEAEPDLLAQRPPRVETDAAPTGGSGQVADALAADEERPADQHRPADGRPRTRFEARGLRLGHQVWDLRYERKR